MTAHDGSLSFSVHDTTQRGRISSAYRHNPKHLTYLMVLSENDHAEYGSCRRYKHPYCRSSMFSLEDLARPPILTTFRTL